jgi:hypothetical protein
MLQMQIWVLFKVSVYWKESTMQCSQRSPLPPPSLQQPLGFSAAQPCLLQVMLESRSTLLPVRPLWSFI